MAELKFVAKLIETILSYVSIKIISNFLFNYESQLLVLCFFFLIAMSLCNAYSVI